MSKTRCDSWSPTRRRAAFTLIEILVVLAIILLVALVSLPVLNAVNGRQVTDAARIFTGSLVGARDSAIKYNSPRGIRLLPDPVLTIPAIGNINAGTTQLCYNRIIPIEPAGDYSEGRITIGPQLPLGATYPTGSTSPTAFPPLYTRWINNTDRWPFFVTGGTSNILMVEESPYVGGFASTTGQPNSPTNWFWNVRVGDKIKIGATGRAYTIVGPCVVNPWKDNGYGLGNTELFVNVGPPGTASQLLRRYYAQSTTGPLTFATLQDLRPEFLFVVNGEDDDLDGYTDEGWDGFDNDSDGLTDEMDVAATPNDWEVEKWTGSIDVSNHLDTDPGTVSPSLAWIQAYYTVGIRDSSYIINRRPVPSPGAREIMLPAGLVIDATTWDSTKERSRIPVKPGSLVCDIMVNPSGRYIPTTEYSSPTSASPLPFLHFWLTNRDDVHPVGTLKDSTGNPILVATATQPYLLPMPTTALGKDASGNVITPTVDGGFYPGAVKTNPVLKGDRRLVTMFAQSGLVTTNPIESIPPINNMQPGEGFNVTDVGYPYYRAQQGSREAR